VKEIDGILTSVERKPFRVVADIGGDQGQFFPSQSGTRLIVDPSVKKLPKGVDRVDKIGDLPETVDLIMVMCVLPHIENPRELLTELRKQCPRATLLVQTAYDRPFLRKFHSSEKYRAYLAKVSKLRFLFVALDFLTGVNRAFSRKVPRFGIVKCSEHINYFTETSLKKVVTTAGYSVVNSIRDDSKRFGWIRLGSLTVVAHPTQTRG
jgi:hypothetical protein